MAVVPEPHALHLLGMKGNSSAVWSLMWKYCISVRTLRCMPIIPVLGRLSQEDPCKLKVSLCVLHRQILSQNNKYLGNGSSSAPASMPCCYYSHVAWTMYMA